MLDGAKDTFNVEAPAATQAPLSADQSNLDAFLVSSKGAGGGGVGSGAGKISGGGGSGAGKISGGGGSGAGKKSKAPGADREQAQKGRALLLPCAQPQNGATPSDDDSDCAVVGAEGGCAAVVKPQAQKRQKVLQVS